MTVQAFSHLSAFFLSKMLCEIYWKNIVFGLIMFCKGKIHFELPALICFLNIFSCTQVVEYQALDWPIQMTTDEERRSLNQTTPRCQLTDHMINGDPLPRDKISLFYQILFWTDSGKVSKV